MTTDGTHDEVDTGNEEEPDFEVVEQSPDEFRALTEALTRHEWTDERFEFEGVDVRTVAGMWLLMSAFWDPEEPVESVSDHPAIDWSARYLAALGSAWGEPQVYELQVSEDTEAPEGPIDLILSSLGYYEALVWQREDRIVAVVSGWKGEPGASGFYTMQLVMPATTYAGGMAAMLTDEECVEPALMHGEELTELHRRAYLLSAKAGNGEWKVLGAEDAEVRATRCEHRFDAEHWALWTFTSDGRALLLIHSLDTHGLLDPNDDDHYEEAIEQLAGLYRGVPEDLLDFATAPASTSAGEIDNPAGFIVDGRELPEISGAFWFDGEDWYSSHGVVAFASKYGVGIDDVGFENCVRRPLRLGGDFGVEDLIDPIRDLLSAENIMQRREQYAALIASCPYPAGARPVGRIRLGTSIPDTTPQQLLDDIESTIDAWWSKDLRTYPPNRCPFEAGGRHLDSNDEKELIAPLAHAEEWFADAFDHWLDNITTAANERWGDCFELSAHDHRTGRTIRTPFTRPLRGQGFESAPVWWVNGMIVSIMHGVPAREDAAHGGILPVGDPGPTSLLYIAPADAILEPMHGDNLVELRFHVRTIAALAGIEQQTLTWNSTPIGARANKPDKDWGLFDHTTAEAVRWVLPAPQSGPGLIPSASGTDDSRGYHAWHFTHDNRALLLTWTEDSPFNVLAAPDATANSLASHVTFGGAQTAFEKQAALFAGVPDDLLSLVADQPENSGMRTIEGADGHSLPAATGVFWFNGLDWCVADGLLAAVHEYVDGPYQDLQPGEISDVPQTTATDVILGGFDGLQTAAYLAAAGADLNSSFFRDHPGYCRDVFGRELHPDEVTQVLGSVDRVEDVVMHGSLNAFLDMQVKATDYDFLVPAALSNPNPRARRELCLWLLGVGASATARNSHSTTLNILLDNEVLDPESDAVLIAELLDLGAAELINEVSPRVRGGGHPLIQLCDHDADDETLRPLYEAFFGGARAAIDDSRFAGLDLNAFLSVDRGVGPDAQSVAEYVAACRFPHSRDRTVLLAYIDEWRETMRQVWREYQAWEVSVADDEYRAAIAESRHIRDQ